MKRLSFVVMFALVIACGLPGEEDALQSLEQGLSRTTATWTATTPGPARIFAPAVFMPSVCRLLVFGGMDTDRTDLFTPATGAWSSVNPKQKPSGRDHAGLSWDPVGKRVILFGGDGAFPLQDTWAFDPAKNAWARLGKNCNASACPPARTVHRQAWSQASGETLVFGGLGPGMHQRRNDLWAFNGAWKEVVTPVRPPARYAFGMAEDAVSGKILIYGGLGDSDVILSDTWVFDPVARTFTELPSAGAPTPRHSVAMGWSPALGAVVVHGGRDAADAYTRESWAFDRASGQWKQLATNAPPPGMEYAQLATDTCSGTALLYGQTDIHAGAGDTWSLD